MTTKTGNSAIATSLSPLPLVLLLLLLLFCSMLLLMLLLPLLVLLISVLLLPSYYWSLLRARVFWLLVLQLVLVGFAGLRRR